MSEQNNRDQYQKEVVKRLKFIFTLLLLSSSFLLQVIMLTVNFLYSHRHPTEGTFDLKTAMHSDKVHSISLQSDPGEPAGFGMANQLGSCGKSEHWLG